MRELIEKTRHKSGVPDYRLKLEKLRVKDAACKYFLQRTVRWNVSITNHDRIDRYRCGYRWKNGSPQKRQESDDRGKKREKNRCKINLERQGVEHALCGRDVLHRRHVADHNARHEGASCYLAAHLLSHADMRNADEASKKIADKDETNGYAHNPTLE